MLQRRSVIVVISYLCYREKRDNEAMKKNKGNNNNGSFRECADNPVHWTESNRMLINACRIKRLTILSARNR